MMDISALRALLAQAADSLAPIIVMTPDGDEWFLDDGDYEETEDGNVLYLHLIDPTAEVE